MAKTKKKELRTHQSAAIQALDRDVTRQQIIMACGTGKTLTAMHTAAELLTTNQALTEVSKYVQESPEGTTGQLRVLVTVPTLSLLDQTYREWVEDAPFEFEALAVGSQPPSRRGKKRKRSAPEPPEDIRIEDLSLENTTSAARVRSWLSAAGTGVKVVFSTYQSVPRIVEAHHHKESPLPRWHVGMIDEAHRTSGAEDKRSGHVLYDHLVPIERRVFLTATPRVHATSRSNTGTVERVASMDDPALYGNPVYTLSTREAIDANILSPYYLAAIHTTHREAQALTEMFSNAEGDDVFSDIAAAVALARATKEHDLRSVIAYFNTVAHSIQFAKVFNWVYDTLFPDSDHRPSISHIDGTMDLQTRREHLDLLAEGTSEAPHIVTNARCLSEGIDVPSLDAVFFAEPRNSPVEVVQCVGRALRRNPNGAVRPAWVILGLVVHEGAESVDDAFEDQGFNKIRETLQAMEDLDPTIRTDLLASITTAQETATVEPTFHDSPTDAATTPEGPTGYEAPQVGPGGSSTNVVPGTDSPGGEVVPVDATSPHINSDAGEYATPQENPEASGSRVVFSFPSSLSDTMRERLVEGFRIELVGRHNIVWDNMFDALHSYVDTHGHYPRYDDPLGKWATRQRAAYRSGKLREDHYERLMGLPGFSWGRSFDRWDEAMSAVKAYIDRYSEIPWDVPEHRDWIDDQVSQYRDGTLFPRHAERLEALTGWTWSHEATTWDIGLAEFARFVESEGRIPPESDWLTEQRAAYARDELTDAQEDKLSAVDEWWWSED